MALAAVSIALPQGVGRWLQASLSRPPGDSMPTAAKVHNRIVPQHTLLGVRNNTSGGRGSADERALTIRSLLLSGPIHSWSVTLNRA